LDEMNLEGKERKSLGEDVGDGENAANYFSLFCSNKMRDIKYKYIYYIPSVNHDGGSYGGFSFFCKNKWSRSITKAAQDWATRFGATFAEIEAEKLVRREMEKHGTKAAMTAIMARNISHNIGSHVISYWNTELQERLKSTESTSGKNYLKEEKFIKTSKELFQYIQHRQDFVAELATSIPCSEMSLDLREDIFDPFISPNEDKYGDAKDSNGNKCISAMLGYIAKSENINMHEEIKLDTEGLTNTRVSIPNGFVGVHAVYSILENFIRNSAKHFKGPIKNNEKMVRIDVKEIDKSRPNNSISEELIRKWKDDYLAVTLWDWRDGSCKEKTIGSHKRFLPGGEDCDFSDSDGSLKSGGWGIKEMLTSANFLRKKTPEDLYKYINNPDESKKEPPLLEAICDNHINCENNKDCSRLASDEEYKGKFGIRFYLRKTKDLAVVLNNDEKKSGFTFSENGLVEKSIFAIKRFDSYQGHAKEISSYNMVLVESGKENKLSDDPTCPYPCRIMPLDNRKGKNGETAGNSNDSNDRYLDLYRDFIKKEFNKDADLPHPKFFEGTTLTDLFSGEGNNSCLEGKAPNKAFKINGNKIVFVYHLNQQKCFSAFAHCYKCTVNIYIQPVSGGYSTYSKLKLLKGNTLDPSIKKQQVLQLAESALTEVVIVDERISDWAKKDFICVGDKEYKISQILKKMSVHVVDIDTENIKYSDLAKKLSSWLKPEDHDKRKQNGCAGTNKEQPKPARFFVIHQGVLDKLKDEDKDIELMNKINCRWQVIDSGRGVPEEKKLIRYPNARFVQISALQKLLENYDKHGLVQTLFSTRRPHN